MQPNEIWKDIQGYEGFYQVSNLGRVRSMDKPYFVDKPHIIRKGKILRLRRQRNGYLKIGLLKGGIQKWYNVHRIVADAFIPNPDNLPYVNHKDENKANNIASNLEWCTPSYNIHFGDAIKKLSKAKTNHPAMSKAVVQIDMYGDIVAEYLSANEAARMTGIKQGTISSCCIGKTKSTHGYVWKYKQ